jgi:hypothetical protein
MHVAHDKRHAASVFIQLADAGLLAWGATAALVPKHLIGPGGAPILEVGYERFTSGSWQELALTSPKTTEFMTLVFRLFGAYGVAFSLIAIAVAATAFRRGERWAWWVLLVGNTIAFGTAMTYDRIVGAIGPFEILEYVGLIGIWVALAFTAKGLRATPRPA